MTIRIETLFDQGTAKTIEDFILAVHPFYGAMDGFSAGYNKDNPPLKYRESLTGGQIVPRIVQATFSNASPERSLQDVLSEANRNVAIVHTERGLLLEQSETLGSATFAISKVGKEITTIIQGGDCFALWKTKNGFGITRNQIFRHDLEIKEEIRRLMKKHNGDRTEMWREILPFMNQKRKERINKNKNGYAVLNGQKKFWNCCFKTDIPTSELIYILLFSDGLVPFQRTGIKEELGEWVIKNYEDGGLNKILQETRKEEEKEKEQSHEDFAEATAIAVNFT